MYCSRRGREVPRPTDTCTRCGRCNWEQNQHSDKPGKAALLTALAILLAVLFFFLG